MRRPLFCASKAVAETLERRMLLSFSPVGAEFRVHSFTTGRQSYPAIGIDADGDFVIAWHSFGQDGSDYGVYAQRYSATGVAQGTEFRVNTYTTGIQNKPAVAMHADGDFIITWGSDTQDGSDYGIYAQRYNAAGVGQGGEFRVNTFTTSYQNNAAIGMDADGDFVISWNSLYQDGSGGYGVYGQRYNAAGVAQGDEFQINTFTPANQNVSAVGMDADGDFVVAWEDGFSSLGNGQDGSYFGVYGRRYNASAAALSDEFRINTFTPNIQRWPEIAMDADGDFVVTWRDGLFQGNGQDGSNYGVYAQRYNAAGVAQGDEFRVNTYTTGAQNRPAIGMNDFGDFVVTWQSSGQDGSLYGVYAQRYNAAGVPLGAEFRVNSFTTNNQGFPAIGMDPDGDVVVAWASTGQDGSDFGIYAQRYDESTATALAVNSSWAEFQTRQAVSMTFNNPLNPATVSANDLAALNLDNASTPVASSVILSAGNTVATWVFNTAGTFIGDGDYQFTLPAGAVTDVYGNSLGSQHVLSGPTIFFLAGDADHDRDVDVNDLGILATNWQQSPRTFSQGDFDYTGTVDVNDLGILATNWQQTVAAPSSPASSAVRKNASLKRIAADVL